MSEFQLTVDLGSQGAARSVTIALRDRAEALLVAQRYDRPSVLWKGDRRVCGISRIGAGGTWVIS